MLAPSFKAVIEPYPIEPADKSASYTPKSPTYSPPPSPPSPAQGSCPLPVGPLPFPSILPLPPYEPLKAPSVYQANNEGQDAPCCAETQTPPVEEKHYEPLHLLQALGASFVLGTAVGAALAFAFSRPISVPLDA